MLKQRKERKGLLKRESMLDSMIDRKQQKRKERSSFIVSLSNDIQPWLGRVSESPPIFMHL